MGCTLSGDLNIYDQKQLDSYLTAEQVRLVKESWKIASDDLPGLGMTMFKKLLSMQKDIAKLFKRLMIKNSNGHVEFDEEKLQNHATIVMEGLGAAVESLEDSVFLTNVLITMGEKHATYNVHPDMVPYLWPAIKGALKDTLKEQFTPDVEKAWVHVFEYIASKFKQGIVQGRQ